MAVTDLTVKFVDDGDRSVLTLIGELDIDGVGEVRRQAQDQLADGRYRVLAIDLSGLTFLDSSGLGLLLELRRMALTADLAFELNKVPSGPARVIAIAGLTDTFGLPGPDGSIAPS
jgi:anti-anti-sigma factor